MRYTIKDKEDKNETEYEVEMSYDDFMAYLKEKPNIQQVFKPLNIADPVRIGAIKPPVKFQREVIDRIQASVPGNTIKDSRKWQTPREW